MIRLFAATLAVFLCLPFSHAQDVPYSRHDARTGQTLEIPLDAQCLGEAQQPNVFAIVLSPHQDYMDWEAAQTLAAIHCSIRLQRETNALLGELIDALRGAE